MSAEPSRRDHGSSPAQAVVPSNSLPLAACERIDRICMEFEDAWKAGGHPRIEQFLEDAAGPERSALLWELLRIELECRLRRGEQSSAEEYCARFPHDAEMTAGIVGEFLARTRDVRPPGTRLHYFGDYELLEEIAQGGMGIVYKARQISLHRLVALKMIRSGQLATAEEVARFRREAEAVASLQHPNVVAIHEVGTHEGQHYFSMDYVEGRSLRDMVRESPLPARRAAQYVKTVAEAVHYAHQQGILHRDLKPANVLFDRGDEPRITDFGLARPIAGASELTGTGEVLGTPSYMPPEQADRRRGELGPASDVYSLGAVLYEAVTGRPPFRAETAAETLLQVLTAEPATPRQLNPGIPRDLETIALKCLEKEPARRYASAGALADDLGRFLGGEPIVARPIGRVARLWRWCRREPVVATLAATVLLTFLAGVSVSLYFAVQARARAQDATERLWDAYLDQARAGDSSGQTGQQFESLEALAAAAAIRPAPELRDEAITCMTLPDARVDKRFESEPEGYAFFDPRMERYACFDRDGVGGNVMVRRAEDRGEVVTLPSPGRLDGIPYFSPDGRLLAQTYLCGGKPVCHVWDLTRRQVVLRVPAERGWWTIDFSPDARSIAVCGTGGEMRVYDISTGQQTAAVPADPPVNRVYFAPDGRHLAIAHTAAGLVRIVDRQSAKTVSVFKHPGLVNFVAWHPHGSLLAVANGNVVHVWDMGSRQERNVLRGHQGKVVALAFNYAGDVVVSSSWDETTRFWDPATGKQLLEIEENAGTVRFSVDDRRLAIGNCLWEIADRIYRVLPANASFSTTRLFDVDTSPDGRLLASACGDGVGLWDLALVRQVAFMPLVEACSARFCPDGRGLVTASDSGIHFWPISSPAPDGVLRIGPPTLLDRSKVDGDRRLALSADGQSLAAVSGEDRVTVWNRMRPGRPRLLQPHLGMAELAISPEGRWVATNTWGGERGVKVWDARTGELMRVLLPDTASTRAQFSPNGRWLVVSASREYGLYETGSWEPAWRAARDREGLAGAIAFSLDSTLLAVSTGRHRVSLIDPATGEHLATLESPGPKLTPCLGFTPDGSRLVAALGLWDLRRAGQRLTAMGLDWELPPLSAAPDADRRPVEVEVVQAEPNPASLPGAAQYRAGNWKAALAAIEQSIELRFGGNAADWLYLAMTHRRLGNKVEARHWYSLALEWMKTNRSDEEPLRRLRDEAARVLQTDY